MEAEVGQYKVPYEFQIQYQKQLKKDKVLASTMMLGQLFDSIKNAKIENKDILENLEFAVNAKLQDEIRIAYLSENLKQLPDKYEEALRMIKLRQEKKIRQYAQNFIKDVTKQIQEEFKYIFYELEKHKSSLIQKELENEMLKIQLQKVQYQLVEIKTWATYDVIAHDRYIEELKEEGITEQDLQKIDEDVYYFQKAYSMTEYYKSVLEQTIIERETLDLRLPFALFNGHIQIGLTERLNLLERETVKVYQKKMNLQAQVMDQIKEQESKPDEVQEVLENEKLEAEKRLSQAQALIQQLQEEIQNLMYQQQEKIRKLQIDSEKVIIELKQRLDSFQDLFLKELMVKDSIIKNIDGMKDHYYNQLKELEIKLKIPKFHQDFLKQKGALSHFIKAEFLGTTAQAKWTLLDTASIEISKIVGEQEIENKDKEKKDWVAKRQKMYGMSELFRENKDALVEKEVKDPNKFRSSKEFQELKSISEMNLKTLSSKNKAKKLKRDKVFSLDLQEVFEKEVDPQRMKQYTARQAEGINISKARRVSLIKKTLKINTNSSPKNILNADLEFQKNKVNQKSQRRKSPILPQKSIKGLSETDIQKFGPQGVDSQSQFKQQTSTNQLHPKILQKYKLNKEMSLEESAEYSSSSKQSLKSQIYNEQNQAAGKQIIDQPIYQFRIKSRSELNKNQKK